MESKHIWIVSVRNESKDVLADLKSVTNNLIEEAHKFPIPELRVGNIDSLFTLCDELRKLDLHVESTLRKIASQYEELQAMKDIAPTRGEEQAKEEKKEAQPPPREALLVKDVSPLVYFTKSFKWDDSRFSKRKSLVELTQIVEVSTARTDAEFRNLSSEFASLESKLLQVKQSTQGNLLTRDITKEIQAKKDYIQETKYLTTVYCVVPSSELTEWTNTYEQLNKFVVPGSSVCLARDNDFSLFLVIVMKHAADDFKNKCRAKRFTTRKFDPSQTITDDAYSALVDKHRKTKRNFLRWTASNFSESFYMWIHLKCIQCYVESILRYGLPANFQAMLLIPRKNQEGTLERALCDHYAKMGRDFGQEEEENEQNEKFFPYVFSEAVIDFK